MPSHAPSLCSCGQVFVAYGEACPCRKEANAAYDKRRPAWRRLYNTPEWRQLRLEILAMHPQCAACGVPAEVVDHIEPHKGDLGLFFDPANLQPLCKRCHDSKTGREVRREQIARRRGVKRRADDEGVCVDRSRVAMAARDRDGNDYKLSLADGKREARAELSTAQPSDDGTKKESSRPRGVGEVCRQAVWDRRGCHDSDGPYFI